MTPREKDTLQRRTCHISATDCQTSGLPGGASKLGPFQDDEAAFYKKAAMRPAPRSAAGKVGMAAGAVAGTGVTEALPGV